MHHRFNPNLIFLIGFMGCGKSHVGTRLAEKMGVSFLDLDEYIESGEQRSISEIFKRYGSAHFRNLEKSYLRKLRTSEKLILATGGGTPCFFDNISWMNEHGLSIYLKAAPELLAKRLHSEKAHRPLIAELKNEELLAFISTKLAERSSFYEAASVVIDQTNMEEDVAEIIFENLSRITGH